MFERFFTSLQGFLSVDGAEDFTLFGVIDGQFLVFAIMFLGILIAVEGIAQLTAFGENREEARNRRMRMLSKGKTNAETLELLKPSNKKGLLNDLPFVGDLPVALRSAGIYLSPGLFLVGCFLAFAIMATLGSQVYPHHIAVPVAFAAFLVLPLMILGLMLQRRRERLIRQLPDALDLMSRGLKVGHPLNTSLQSVADEMPDPIGTEFGIVIDQITYGDELPVAMRELAQRIDEEDFYYLSIAVTMQHGTGGDLANVLETLARVIRARMALRRRVKALSAEGRMTAYILSAIPFLIFGVMTYTNPAYYGDVMDYPYFWPIMAAILGAVILNALVMFRLVKFRI